MLDDLPGVTLSFQNDGVGNRFLAKLAPDWVHSLLSILLNPLLHTLLMDKLDAACALAGCDQPIPFDITFQAYPALSTFHCHFLLGVHNVRIGSEDDFVGNGMRPPRPGHCL